MPQSSAVLDRLLPSIIARAWSSQRSLLRRCAIGVLVSALKVRPQPLQRNRESPPERPEAMTSRPAQCGHPWLSTRSWPLVPKASGRRRFAPSAPLPVPPFAAVSDAAFGAEPCRPPSRFASAAKPDREILRPHRIKPSPTPRQTDPNQQLTL